MQKLSRNSSKVYSASKWNKGLTDTIIEVEELGWSSCSSGRWWLIVKVQFCSLRSDKEEVQLRGVRNWEGDWKEFRLVELSRWIVASEWLLCSCTKYLYPDGHVSFQFWARVINIIWWGNQERARWLCRPQFAAETSFWIILECFRWGDEEIRLRQVLKSS